MFVFWNITILKHQLVKLNEMFVFIAYSFKKINSLKLNSFKKIKCNYGKTINCITDELYYYRYRVAAGLPFPI